MILQLAQEQPTSRGDVFEIITNTFSRMDVLAHPKDLVGNLQHLPVVWGVVFLVAGIVSMLQGYRYHKAVTIGLALAMGAVAGYALGKHIHASHIMAVSVGLLVSVACLPLMKYAVAAMGGIVGGFLGANLWTSAATMAAKQGHNFPPENHWIGALVGMIVCGMLAFILFKFSVILFTSVSGSTLAMIGAVGLLLQWPAAREGVASNLTAHTAIIPLLVVIPAAIGLILQEADKEAAPAAAPAKAK